MQSGQHLLKFIPSQPLPSLSPSSRETCPCPQAWSSLPPPRTQGIQAPGLLEAVPSVESPFAQGAGHMWNIVSVDGENRALCLLHSIPGEVVHGRRAPSVCLGCRRAPRAGPHSGASLFVCGLVHSSLQLLSYTLALSPALGPHVRRGISHRPALP